MGTQIQSEIYLLGHCSKRDVNVNMSSGTWPLYGEENALKNGQHHDSSMAWRALMGGYLGHDKEKVRETIMKHESIFRHQVQELHRLYRRQRDLMYGIKMKELHNHQKKTERSQSGLVSSYISSEDAKRTWHGSHFSSSNSLLSQFPPPGASDKRSPATVMEGKSLLCSFASQEMGCLEKHESLKSHLADLNEPIQLVETSLSSSLKSSGNMFFLTENSSFGSQHHMTGMDGKTGLNNLLLDNGRTGKEQITYSFKTGIYSGDSRTDFKSSHVERKTEHQSKRRIFGVEIFEEDDEPSLVSSGITHSNHKSNELQTYFSSVPSRRTVPSYSGKKVISHINHGATTSESSRWKSDSILQNLKFGGGAVLDNSDTRKFSSSKNEVPYRSGFCVNLQLDSKSVTDSSSTGFNFLNGKNAVNLVPDQFALHDSTKCWKGVHSTDWKAAKLLKSDSETTNMWDASVLEHDPSSASSQSKALPWFMINPQQYNGEKARGRENSSGMNLDSLQKCSQHFLKKTEITQNFSQIVNLKQEPNLSTTTEDSLGKRVDCINGKKIFGFRIPEVVGKTDDIDPTGFVSEASCSDGTKFPNQLEANPNVPEKGLNNYISGLRHHIDLNLSMNEEETSSAPTLPAALLKIATTEIDLEVPAVLESEVSASEADHKETRFYVGESNGTHQDLIRMAAEAIVSISSAPVKDVADCGICQPLEATSPDCLKWFVEVVSSYNSDQESKVREVSVDIDGSYDEESLPDGMDYFEFMTLKLKDVKEENFCYKLPNIDNQDDDEPAVTTMPKRPRRGQGRRGRHMKDFQRDVLPSLVSLSKQEVVEDLQTIEHLFIASGCNLQSSLSHRNGRGRRRAGGSVPSSLKNSIYPPPPEKPICRELGLGDKSLPGWGKRTRRLPRQRNLKK